MISFRSFSLVISIVMLRQIALQTWGDVDAAVSAEKHPFNWLICGCVLFCVIGKFLPVAAMIRADSVGRRQGWREMEQNRGWLEWSWLLAQGWLLANSGAARALADAELQGWSPALMMCVWFVPTIVFFAALEFGYTQLECLWSADGDQSSRAHRVRWFTRVRLGALGNIITCLMPVLLLLTVVDVLQAMLPGLSDLTRATLALACLGAVGMTFAPLWLRVWMGARAIPATDPVAQRVATFVSQMKISLPRVCSVGPRQTWHGIALVGWTPLFRQLWIGSSIAQGLTAEQLDMVLLHELAHLKRGHCWWRIIPLLVVGATCALALTNWPFDDAGWTQLVLSLAMAGGMIWLLGLISRQCELDADRQASLFAAKYCQWADGQPARAMSVLAEALVVLHHPDTRATQLQWLHPTLAKRIAMKP